MLETPVAALDGCASSLGTTALAGVLGAPPTGRPSQSFSTASPDAPLAAPDALVAVLAATCCFVAICSLESTRSRSAACAASSRSSAARTERASAERFACRYV